MFGEDMRRFRLFNLALACALLINFPAARAQEAQQTKAPNAPASAAAPATSAALPAAALEAANAITAARLSEHLHFVASDAMGGRDTPSKGLDDTAKFLADNLAKLKIKPAGDDGTYFQKIELVSFKVDPAQSSFRLQERAFKFGEDFLVGAGRSASASGALVYAGHGYVVKSKNINAYNGLDVRDKVVIAAGGVLPIVQHRTTDSGVNGDSSQATAEAGTAILGRAASQLRAIAEELMDIDIDPFRR